MKQIQDSTYMYLKIQEARLQQLEDNGVDNWEHYGCMCYERGEEECIFCTEDEVGFLGLIEEVI